ncbi:DUF58 domain-containing protein [Rhodohalobacter halophilus]|uniref:DUF58 domain-containing protein n=1 Tax=Rhodohalobacter halophilus TaxID=1812810 RepID=UPI00083F7DE2|nr:DUF58 domain-containing protein [Rhodohalobacter halophilus]
MLLNPDLLSQLAPLELKARRIVEGFISGLHKSPYHGFSVEFAEHKPYNQGDDFKHIDWKVYGKTERFYVKKYEAETNLRAHVVLDISSSMNYKYFADWSKLTYSVHYAAALMHMMNRQRDACGLVLFDDQVHEMIPPKSSYTHLRMLFNRLKKVMEDNPGAEEVRRSASADALNQLAENLKRRSLVVIITDLFENVKGHDELISSLRHLRHKRHEVLLFNVLEHKSERDLDFPDGQYLFEDMETGRQLEMNPAQFRNSYQQKVEEYTRKFKIACSEAGVDFEEIDTQKPFDLALLAYLNKRKRLA